VPKLRRQDFFSEEDSPEWMSLDLDSRNKDRRDNARRSKSNKFSKKQKHRRDKRQSHFYDE